MVGEPVHHRRHRMLADAVVDLVPAGVADLLVDPVVEL